MHLETINWRDTLAPGDIVAFAFPTTEPGASDEKHRPALVLAIDRSGAVAEATIVYGTGAMTRANTGLELRVTTPADMAAARLHKPTRFVGTRRVRVPLDSPRFIVCAASTAVIGRLPQSFRPRLEQIQILAETLHAPARQSPRRRSRCRLYSTRRHQD
ncbi:MAG: hypothetical protein ACU0B7_00970 [Paracoccaceae bacterium]